LILIHKKRWNRIKLNIEGKAWLSYWYRMYS